MPKDELIKKAHERLKAARLKMLMEQRVCSWCNFKATSSDELVQHILDNHSAPKQ